MLSQEQLSDLEKDVNESIGAYFHSGEDISGVFKLISDMFDENGADFSNLKNKSSLDILSDINKVMGEQKIEPEKQKLIYSLIAPNCYEYMYN